MRSAAPTERAIHISILVLIAVAAAIHFARAVADPDIRVLFVLNGLGFLALGVLLMVPWTSGRARLVRRVTIGYAALTSLLYVVWGVMGGEWTVPAGPIALAGELLLIGLLVWRDRRQGRVGRVPAGG